MSLSWRGDRGTLFELCPWSRGVLVMLLTFPMPQCLGPEDGMMGTVATFRTWDGLLHVWEGLCGVCVDTDVSGRTGPGPRGL